MTLAKMIVASWCICAGLTDLYFRRLPNLLTLGMCLVATGWLLATGHAMLGVNWSSVVPGVLVSLLLTLPAYAVGWLGAGDVKMLLAIALLTGSEGMLVAFVIAAILAALFCIVTFCINQSSTSSLRSTRWIPFGAALGAGLLCVIVTGSGT